MDAADRFRRPFRSLHFLLKEVETDTAALLEDLRDLDDLVLQFAESASGPRFVQAWKQVRIIVDAGHGPGEEQAPASPPPAPPAA